MQRAFFEHWLAVNRGFQQVIDNLAAFRQHPEFNPAELKRLTALSKEARAVTNSYLASVDRGGGNGRRRPPPSQAPAPGAERGTELTHVVELASFVLVPHPKSPSQRRNHWLAIHPVYVWQFRACLSLVQVSRSRIEFKIPNDFLVDRFASLDPKAYVTNVYHAEAVAYAHWFGRALCGQVDWYATRQFLSRAEFSSVLPPQFPCMG
jgi:hypothetical protein